MDIKQLRALVALAEQGNYRQAASLLCISQPALSKQIQALETQLGVRLFERGRQGRCSPPVGSSSTRRRRRWWNSTSSFSGAPGG